MIELLDGLVTRLFQLALADYVEDPSQLLAALAERERILAALAEADLSSLSEEQRAGIKARLCTLEERDRQQLSELRALQAELLKAMEKLTSGRAAVRGYGSQSDRPGSQLRRIG